MKRSAIVMACLMCASGAYAQVAPVSPVAAPGPIHAPVVPSGPEGEAGDAVGLLSAGAIVNAMQQYVGVRFYADALIGVKLNPSSYWTEALVVGSAMDVNDGGILVKPDIGFLFRTPYGFVTFTGGPSILHGFACCANPNTWFGYHFSMEPGFRFGPIQLGIPLSIGQFAGGPDWFTVFSAGGDLGVQF